MEVMMSKIVKTRFGYCLSRIIVICLLTTACVFSIGCSHDEHSLDLLPYLVFAHGDVSIEYGFYKCSYAHYRDGVPVSGSEDVFKVKAGTIISYDGHQHVIVANEIFDANSWFLDN